MTSTLSERELESLGLRRELLGEHATLGWPEDPVARGLPPRGVVAGLMALVASEFAGLHFAQAALRPLEERGARVEVLEEDPRVLKFVGPPGGSVTLRVLPDATQAWHVDRDDPATAFLDLREAHLVRLVLPDGTGWLVARGPGGIEFYFTAARPLTVDPLADVQSPVLEWCQESGDPWLEHEVTARVARGDPWEHAVAVGIVARFAGWARPSGEVVASLLAKAVDRDMARPRLWARALGDAEVRTVVLLARAEIMRLHAMLDELQDTMVCDDPGWQERLLELCHARDDLEGVRLLLVERGAAERIADDLDVLDDAGALFMRTLPVAVALDDEGLERAGRLEPEAWWVAPVRTRDGSAAEDA